jgi:sugar/nucleoside kinase (ribokinase family)
MLDLLSTGYPSLDYICRISHSPAVGETGLVRSLPSRYTFGGCGANVAVGLARLGFRTGVAMVVGDDGPGQAYISQLQAEGVDTRDVIRLPQSSTSESRLYVNPAGEYQNFFYPGAADAWQGELGLKLLPETLHALLTVGALPYNRQFAQLVHRAGIPLIWQLKPDIYAYPPEVLADLAHRSVLLLMNRIDVTRGADGSRIFEAEHVHDVPVVSPLRSVDTTGAGDAFSAGFLAGWLQGRSPGVCGQLGAVVASFGLEAVGCQTNLPDWATMKHRFEENFGEL